MHVCTATFNFCHGNEGTFHSGEVKLANQCEFGALGRLPCDQTDGASYSGGGSGRSSSNT